MPSFYLISIKKINVGSIRGSREMVLCGAKFMGMSWHKDDVNIGIYTTTHVNMKLKQLDFGEQYRSYHGSLTFKC